MDTWKHLRAILLLPGMLAVVIPTTALVLKGLDTFGLWQSVMSFADSEELVITSELPASALIEVGTNHRLAGYTECDAGGVPGAATATEP